MVSAALSLLIALSTAHAVPGQFTHQGRLLDVDELPMDGEIDATFRLVDGETGGAVVWEETLTLTLTNGFYAAVLGAEVEDNPLDVDVLDQAPLWLELQLDGVAPMFPRHPINAVPYATMAGIAEEVSGGPVDASEVSIAGSLTIDAEGRWVGPTPEVSWEDIADIPAGVEEDIDTVLSSEEVEGYITDGAIDLASGTTLGGSDISTGEHTTTLDWSDIFGIPDDFVDGTDADTWLSADDVIGYITGAAIDLASGTTLGGSDISTGPHTTTLGWGDIFGIPDDFADGTDDDSQLSASEVESFITDGAIDLASGTTLDGADISTGEHSSSDDVFFGDGSDGDVTVSSTLEIDRAMQYTNFTIEDGGTLRTSSSSNASLVIFVTDTLTIDGRIDMDGQGAPAGSAGDGGYGGAYTCCPLASAQQGESGSRGGSGFGHGYSGGDGKAGGGGGGATHPGASGGALVEGATSTNDRRKALSRYAASTLPELYGSGGSGGSGGGGGGHSSRTDAPAGNGGEGGDGGAGGGGIIISAKNIVVGSGGVITADGLAGSSASDGTNGSAGSHDGETFGAGGGGGGAGGGGGESGTIILIYTSLDNSGTISSSGGSGGTGGEGGDRASADFDGADGSDGPTGDDGDSNPIISLDVSTGG